MRRDNIILVLRLLTLTIVLLVAVRTRSFDQMTTQNWLAILYPILTGVSFVVTAVFALYYIKVRPIRLVLATIFYFLTETVVLFLLTLTTVPVLTADQARPLIGWARLFMLVALLWLINDGAKMVFGGNSDQK